MSPACFFCGPMLATLATIDKALRSGEHSLLAHTSSHPCRRTMRTDRSRYMSGRFIRLVICLLVAAARPEPTSAQAITYDFETHPSNQTWYLSSFDLWTTAQAHSPTHSVLVNGV